MIKTLCAVLLAVSFTFAAQAQQAPVSPSPVKRSNFEVITAMVELAPGFKAGRHSHPGVVQAQVLEGEFMLAIDGQPEKIFKPGESLEIATGTIHNEGAVGDKPAKLIAVYVVEKGKPLVTPAK